MLYITDRKNLIKKKILKHELIDKFDNFNSSYRLKKNIDSQLRISSNISFIENNSGRKKISIDFLKNKTDESENEILKIEEKKFLIPQNSTKDNNQAE